jgi:hypothetical protein
MLSQPSGVAMGVLQGLIPPSKKNRYPKAISDPFRMSELALKELYAEIL